MRFVLQSAMEYLMTYGWAMLVIAVILIALYALGVFNGSLLRTNGCVATSGFECSNPVYEHNTGNVVVIFGQDTGQTWTTANIAFVNQSFTSNVLITGIAGLPQSVIANGLITSTPIQVSIPISGPVSIGTPMSGYFWVSYTTRASPSTLYQEVAIVTLKAS